MTKSLPNHSIKFLYLDSKIVMRPYRLCKLRDYDKSLEKPWHVEYYIWDMNEEKLVRRRVTLSHPTARERYKWGQIIMKDIDTYLKKGAVLNLPKEEILPIDKIASNTSIIKSLDTFITFHESFLAPNTLSTYKSHIKRFKKYLEIKAIDKTMEEWTNLDSLKYLDYTIQKLNLGSIRIFVGRVNI